jgi:hypothetical protein
MSNKIVDNASKVLVALFENNPEQNLQFDGNEIAKLTGLSAIDINDAIEFLDDRGLIERLNYMGTAPFYFGQVSLNSRGNYLYHEINNQENILDNDRHISSEIISKQPLAAGSPFGFTDMGVCSTGES